MTIEIPYYGLRAYALFFSKHGTDEEFMQSDLDWIVSGPMKKKIFSLLVNSGGITKTSRNSYKCKSPEKSIENLLEFRVPEIMKETKKEYTFTGASAVEVWSDYCYVQRGKEKSPYFVKIYKKDLNYWKVFFNKNKIPNYVGHGTTIGEYVILIPVDKFEYRKRDGINVEPLEITKKIAKENPMYQYAYEYIKNKYGD